MGASKLVVHDQDLLMENALSCARKYRFSAQDRAAIPVPIAHLYGLGAELLPALFSGASIDLQDQTHLLKYLDRERLFEPNIAFMTPGLCELLLKGFKTPRTRYRLVVTSGQRIGDALFDAFDARIGGCLVNQYGSSELGATAACDPEDALDLKRQTIGRPFPGVLLSIEPPDSGLKHTPLPGTEGNTGELYCQHPFGFLGYVDDSGRWLLRRNPASWHPTGDLAHQDVQGHFQILDRAGNSINRRGYLVSFAELERQFESIWNKERVVVVRSEHHTPGSERIAAFCVSESRSGNSSSPPGEVLRDLCVQRLPPWAVPDDVYVIDAFPILSSGKVDIQRLVSMAVSAQVSREISGDHLRAGSIASTISTAAHLQGVESS
jgi:acyl-CoA synthetase (AMP-forming)/AMP-acid ligase II